MDPLSIAIGATLLYGGYKVFFDKPKRFVGDLAQVGDEVVVSVNNLTQQNKNLPVMPADTASVTVEVQGVDADRLQGPIVAFGPLRIPAKLGSFVVHRVIVEKVIRGGKVATSVTGSGSTFTGDRQASRQQFRG
jgi:hypothetical protein